MKTILWDLAAGDQIQILLEKVMLLLLANVQLIISLLHQAHNLHVTNYPPVYLHGFFLTIILGPICVQPLEKKIGATSSHCKNYHVKLVPFLVCFYLLICVWVNNVEHKRHLLQNMKIFSSVIICTSCPNESIICIHFEDFNFNAYSHSPLIQHFLGFHGL